MELAVDIAVACATQDWKHFRVGSGFVQFEWHESITETAAADISLTAESITAVRSSHGDLCIFEITSTTRVTAYGAVVELLFVRMCVGVTGMLEGEAGVPARNEPVALEFRKISEEVTDEIRSL